MNNLGGVYILCILHAVQNMKFDILNVDAFMLLYIAFML